MDWSDYKALCDSPRMFSRWMLEQSIELLYESPQLAAALSDVLKAGPLAKPRDHRGGAPTDMFEVVLDIGNAVRIHRIIVEAVRAERRTDATKLRGLGGFAEAWLEYVIHIQQGDIKMSGASKTIVSLIDAFNANDLNRIMGHFTNDAVYHNMPTAPVSGLPAIRDVLQGFMSMASEIDWQLRTIAETADGTVLTERVDRFLINGKWVALPVMGSFEVTSSKISAWRDYFDMNQFQSQLAG